MRERVLAIIGAIGLVCVALFVRSKLADGNGPTTPHRGSSTRPAVACTTDLMAVCDALAAAGKVAPNPATLDLDATADEIDAVDAWITWDPAPAIVDAPSSSSGAPAHWGDPTALASAPVAMLLDREALRTIQQECGIQSWICISTHLDGTATGVGDPSTAEGIARLAPIARALAPGGDYTQLDTPALQQIIGGPPDGQDDAVTMAAKMASAPGYANAVVGPEPLLQRTSETTRGRDRQLKVRTPHAVKRLTVVVVPRHGSTLSGAGSWCRVAADELTALGLDPCTGRPDHALAGFLYQVGKKVD